MFAGTAVSVCLLVYVGLSLFIIGGPYVYMVVCVLYAYNLTLLLEKLLLWLKPQQGNEFGYLLQAGFHKRYS